MVYTSVNFLAFALGKVVVGQRSIKRNLPLEPLTKLFTSRVRRERLPNYQRLFNGFAGARARTRGASSAGYPAGIRACGCSADSCRNKLKTGCELQIEMTRGSLDLGPLSAEEAAIPNQTALA